MIGSPNFSVGHTVSTRGCSWSEGKMLELLKGSCGSYFGCSWCC